MTTNLEVNLNTLSGHRIGAVLATIGPFSVCIEPLVMHSPGLGGWISTFTLFHYRRALVQTRLDIVVRSGMYK